jgi:hypothetical protein
LGGEFTGPLQLPGGSSVSLPVPDIGLDFPLEIPEVLGNNIFQIGEYGTTPAGRPFTKHYATETGPQRNIPVTLVDSIIDDVQGIAIEAGKTLYYDLTNDITVITGDGDSIVSVHKGQPRKGQLKP